jgi:hypothetical protein
VNQKARGACCGLLVPIVKTGDYRRLSCQTDRRADLFPTAVKFRDRAKFEYRASPIGTVDVRRNATYGQSALTGPFLQFVRAVVFD